MSAVAKAITALVVPVIVVLLGKIGVNDLDLSALQTLVLAIVGAVSVYAVPNR